jgi:polysaccharide export outer membrane protein
MMNKLLMTTLAMVLLSSQAAAQSGGCPTDPSACEDAQADGAPPQQEPARPRSEIPTIVTPVQANQAREDRSKPMREMKPQAPRLRPEPPTEFQRFVESSLGYRMPLFGYDLFEDVPSTFAPLDQVPVPSDYILGPGDELLVRAWGQVNVDAKLVVDRDGSIFIPTVGQIAVAGVRYDQLASRLKDAARRVFRNFDLTVTLGQLRSIQVYVVGDARQPGSYTVSSLSTLVNALFAAGGPSRHGTMRDIQVRRNDRLVTDFDLYDLLLKGDKSKDIVLEPGDVIFIPHIGAEVAVAGSVTFPAIYELRGKATLGEELEAAGELSSVADGDRVMVERVDGHATRKVDQIRLDTEGKARELKDGDLVRVFSISPRFEATVTLRGNVAQPGRYPFVPGMRIRDLIPNREFLLTRAFWQVQNGNTKSRLQTSSSADAAEDKPGDKQDGKAEDGPNDQHDVSLDSRRIRPRNDSFSDWDSQPDLPDTKTGAAIHGQTALHNEISRSAPDINWDYAVIQRLNKADLSTTLVTFNLGNAILGGNEADNVALESGDVVTIFSQRDIAVPDEHQTKYVRLEGEFRAPGVYKVESRRDLCKSLAARAGGLTEPGISCSAPNLRATRPSDEQQASLDRMVADLELEAQQQAVYLASRSGPAAERALVCGIAPDPGRQAARHQGHRTRGARSSAQTI